MKVVAVTHRAKIPARNGIRPDSLTGTWPETGPRVIASKSFAGGRARLGKCVPKVGVPRALGTGGRGQPPAAWASLLIAFQCPWGNGGSIGALGIEVLGLGFNVHGGVDPPSSLIMAGWYVYRVICSSVICVLLEGVSGCDRSIGCAMVMEKFAFKRCDDGIEAIERDIF